MVHKITRFCLLQCIHLEFFSSEVVFTVFLFSKFLMLMKKESFTRLMLVIMFLGFFISSLVILTLEKSKEDVGIFKILPIILLIALFNFIRRRLKEKWEVPNGWSIVLSIFLLCIPLLNLFILYDLLKDSKRHSAGKSSDSNDIEA